MQLTAFLYLVIDLRKHVMELANDERTDVKVLAQRYAGMLQVRKYAYARTNMHMYIHQHSRSQAGICIRTHNFLCTHKTYTPSTCTYNDMPSHKQLPVQAHTIASVYTNIQNTHTNSLFTQTDTLCLFRMPPFIQLPLHLFSSYSYISITNITKSNTLFILIICLGTLYIFSPPPSYSYVCRICFPMHSSSSSSPRPLLPLLLLR